MSGAGVGSTGARGAGTARSVRSALLEESPEALQSRAKNRGGRPGGGAAKHHHGPYGFLTEGVDWNDHVSQQHHINQAKYGDIQYTEPFLNNQHIAEPTLFYLERLARQIRSKGTREWRDCENNLLLRLTTSKR